jgi:hypothetical protein
MNEQATFDAEDIRLQNETFHKMSRPEQCVAVARDVLRQLETGVYKANSGNYVGFYGQDTILYAASASSLQETLLTKQPNCSVCALGGAFLSLVRLGNQLDFQHGKSSPYQEALAPYFGKFQVDLMEAAFEGWECDHNNTEEEDLSIRAKDFYRDHKGNQTERLQAIFQNIIDNGGKFLP